MNGIKASEGISIGYAHILKEQSIEIVEITELPLEEELLRFEAAKAKAVSDLDIIKQNTLETIGESEAEVFEAHKQLILDPVMSKEIIELLNQNKTCEYSFSQVIEKYIEMFKALDNDYMRERAADLKDIKTRILKLLSNTEESTEILKENAIIVTYDLTPSETVGLDRAKTIGFITEIGGETSHSAIIARTLNIPAVVGVGEVIQSINQDDIIILDGTSGKIIINPTDEVIKNYQQLQKDFIEKKNLLNVYKNKTSITKEGKIIEIAGNIAGVDDVHAVLEVTGDGIGLFRSEFLYMNRSELPSEDEQFEAYKAVLSAMGDKPVTIRTMDIGGDKNLDYLNLEPEMNPFLGYRAIRICLKDIPLFKTQLRALLRASTYGKLRIMFPMIASLEELLEAKSILKSCEQDLVLEGIKINEYQVGIMIEVPAAALIADILAEEVDFFSIGTNDLIQYTTAVDRMNNKIAELYSPYHPGFIRLLKHISDAAHDADIEIGMCGNVAGDPNFISFLLNIGLDELSMSPNAILKARSIVNNHINTDISDIFKLKTKDEVKTYLEAIK